MPESEPTLHDRIGRVINTRAFRSALSDADVDLIEFQSTWYKESGGDFEKLPELYQQAILAGQAELADVGDLVFA